MLKIAIVILLSFCYVISLIPYIRISEKKITINLLNISTLVLMSSYGVLFPLNYFLTLLGYNSTNNILLYSNYDEFDFLSYYFAVACVSHIFLFVLKHRKEIRLFGDDEANNLNNKTSTIKVTAFILFIIGVVSNYLYLKAYGGFFNYLEYSGLLRSGVMIVDNKFSFIYPFRGCILFSSYLFIILFRKNKKNVAFLALMIISVILSLSVLYSNKGRLGLVLYLLLAIIALFKKNYNKFLSIKDVFKVLLFATFGVILISIVGEEMGRNGESPFLELFNSEISFAFLNFKRITEYCNLSNYRFFADIVLLPIYLLPSSIWGSKFHISTSSTINTIAWFGSAKGVNGIHGEMPIDFISLSYMQLGYIGIFVLPLFFAIFYHKAFKISGIIKDNDVSQFVKYYILIYIGVHSLFYADPYLIIKNNIGFIIFIIVYLFIDVINKIKRTKKEDVQ